MRSTGLPHVREYKGLCNNYQEGGGGGEAEKLELSSKS